MSPAERPPRNPPSPVPPAAEGAVPLALHQLPGHLIRRAHQISVSLFFQECGELPLTPIQYAILKVLSGEDQVDQISLAYKVALDRSTLADVARRLEEKGWLRREPGSQDRRQKLLSISEPGRQMLVASEAAVQRVQERILAPLPAAERQTFVELLNKLVESNNDASRAPYRDEG